MFIESLVPTFRTVFRLVVPYESFARDITKMVAQFLAEQAIYNQEGKTWRHDLFTHEVGTDFIKTIRKCGKRRCERNIVKTIEDLKRQFEANHEYERKLLLKVRGIIVEDYLC